MITLRKSERYPFVFVNSDTELSPMLVRTLDIETSFMPQNIDFILKNRKSDEPWDGRIRLMRKSKNNSLYFPIGLLPKVRKTLKWSDIVPEEQLAFLSSDETLNISWNGPELYTHQIDGFIESIKAERCIICLPTAAGKTILGVKIISALAKPTLILVNRKELATQWKNAIKTNTKGVEPIVFNDKNKKFGEITIAMVGSLYNWLKKNNMPIFDVLLSDECHHVPADTIYRITMKCDARYRIGLSATPTREDGNDLFLEAAIGPQCINISAEDLIDKNLLATPEFEFIELPPSMMYSRYGDYEMEYKTGIVLNEERNKTIVARAKQLVKDGRTIYIHVTRIDHGKLLCKMLNAPFVYSKSKDREEEIEKFKSGETKILISTLLGEGFDLTGIDVIIMASGGKSEGATIQRVGRALRPKPGKVAKIIDFIDRGKYLAKHTTLRYQAYVKHYGVECVNRGRR